MSRVRRWLLKIILMLGSIALTVVVFLAIDFVYTAASARYRKAAFDSSLCRVPDSVRQHAFQPNCTGITAWGGAPYPISTNSLGLRDEKVREVPLRDAKPRILVLGDSMTEGMGPWDETIVAKIAAHFPQYDFLNGGMVSYAPSNYLNVTRMVLAAGVEIDEVLVLIDISDAQDEAAFYRDVDATGAVAGPVREQMVAPKWRLRVMNHLRVTNHIVNLFERSLIRHGYYHLFNWGGDLFDRERSAWTYRKVSETEPYHAGYAPLGLEGGIAKEKAKMTLLWQELASRHIPVSVGVYPWPAQIVHDTPDSRQVRIWRDWCEGKCKRVISVFPAFQSVKDQCPPSQPGCWYLKYFIFGDMHFNAEGNAIFADVVIRSLEGALPVKNTTRLDLTARAPADPYVAGVRIK
jgi:hypothetical protein